MTTTHTERTYRGTVTLTQAEHDAYKRTGLTLADLVRRGLDDPGNRERHAAAETRLAHIEQRLGQLEYRFSIASDYPADEATTPEQDADDDEAWQAERERHKRDRAAARAAQLRASLPLVDGQQVATARDAAAAFGVSQQTAIHAMDDLVARGHAIHLPRKEGTGQPHKWLISADETDKDPAATR